MASETAATVLGMGEAGPHKQPRIGETDRRESWIPYPVLPDAGEPAGIMDYAEFTRRCQEDVDALFNMFSEMYESSEATIATLKSQNSDLEEENRKLKDDVSRRDEQADDLIEERDRLQRTVVHLAASQVGSTVSREVSATPTEKSVKIPNPPVLTNGKDPEFEDWESRIRSKLKANADHYNTDALRIAYVENRTGGKAAKHLRPRLRVNAINPYITAEEMLKHLESIFQDPNREANSKREFRKLDMKKADKFQDFLTDFLYLAGEAKIPATMYKDELYQRMTWKLQEMTVKEWMNSDLDFDAFIAICTKLADHLLVINESRNQSRRTGRLDASTPGATKESEASTSRTEERKCEGTLTSGTVSAFRATVKELPPEKRELLRNGKCFSCRLPGHLSWDCPQKIKETPVKRIEPKEENGDEEPSLPALGKVTYLGQERVIDLSILDLSQLLGGQQFSVPTQIGKNGYGVQADSLADTGANGYAFINTEFAVQVAKFCQTPAIRLQEVCYVKGYDGKTKEPVTHVIFLDLRIDGRQFKEVPLLIADLGNHEIILGRKWLAEQDIWLDVKNRRMIWPNERSPEEQVRLRNELVAPKGALDRPAPNPTHQKEMERRDRAIEAHDRKIQILKRNTGENPRIPFQPPRNYQMDQFAAMQKMKRAMKGTEHSRPKENS